MENYLGKLKVLFSLKNEGKFISCLKCMKIFHKNREENCVFHGYLKPFSVLQLSNHCKLHHGIQVFPVPVLLRAGLSDYTPFLLKIFEKWQNNLYSSCNIWVIQIRLFETTEAERASSISSVLCYLKHHNIQIPSGKLSPTWRQYPVLFSLVISLGCYTKNFTASKTWQWE